MSQVYYKIFCAARKIVLEEIRAQLHLEVHCHLNMEPPAAQHPVAPAVNRQLNSSDMQTSQGSPLVKQHRSSSASTTVSSSLSLSLSLRIDTKNVARDGHAFHPAINSFLLASASEELRLIFTSRERNWVNLET